MALLLTYQQQQTIKPIGGLNSANQVAQSKYDQLAAEVESLEIDKLLNTKFYQDVSQNPANYTDLLDGVAFENCNGDTVTHRGLRYVIAYLNYEQYISISQVNDTWTGLVQKTRPDSERISTGELKNLRANSRQIAFNAWDLIVEYLNLNTDTYTYWCQSNSKRTKAPKFRGIRKTLY